MNSIDDVVEKENHTPRKSLPRYKAALAGAALTLAALTSGCVADKSGVFRYDDQGQKYYVELEPGEVVGEWGSRLFGYNETHNPNVGIWQRALGEDEEFVLGIDAPTNILRMGFRKVDEFGQYLNKEFLYGSGALFILLGRLPDKVLSLLGLVPLGSQFNRGVMDAVSGETDPHKLRLDSVDRLNLGLTNSAFLGAAGYGGYELSKDDDDRSSGGYSSDFGSGVGGN